MCPSCHELKYTQIIVRVQVFCRWAALTNAAEARFPTNGEVSQNWMKMVLLEIIVNTDQGEVRIVF